MKKTGMERAVNFLTGMLACTVVACLIAICIYGTIVLIRG